MQTKFARHRRIATIVFLTPAMLFIVGLFILPVLQSFFYSFTNWDGITQSYDFVGFKNFETVLTARQSWTVIRNTFYLAIIYIPVLNIMALMLAVLVKDSGRKVQNIYKSVFFFPNLLAMAVVGYVWKMLLDPTVGALNKFLRSIGLGDLAIDWLGTVSTVLPVISVTTLWFATGFYMIIYFAGLMGISNELYEASSIDGASRWKQFRFITLPMLAPSITINVILSTIGILTSFDLPYVMTKGGPGYYSTTMALQIFFYNSKGLQLANGVAMSVVLCIVSIIITAILFKITNRKEAY